MNYVLITISGGIIDQVKFYQDGKEAYRSIEEFVQTMDPEKEDAGLYSQEGMVVNAKHFLDE